MANNTTALQGPLLLGTQLQLVTPTTVAGTFYGIAFTLFCLYVHYLVPRFQDEDRKRQAKFMLGYTSVIMLCGLCTLVMNAWVIQDAYIKHADYPRGPYIYTISTTHTKPAIAVLFTCQLAIDILTSAIQIWRVWVIWSATRFAKLVIVLPLLCLLTFAALTLRSVILETTLPIAEVSLLDTKTQFAGLSMQAITTILCTVLISVYLTYEYWRQRKLMGEANGSAGYIKIVAMLIESYTLESIWLLAEAILLLHPVTIFFVEGRNYIEIIAYLLVQYRVASGTAAYESQRGQSKISSLHWNHSKHGTTRFGEASEVVDDHHGPVKPEADVVQLVQVSSMA